MQRTIIPFFLIVAVLFGFNLFFQNSTGDSIVDIVKPAFEDTPTAAPDDDAEPEAPAKGEKDSGKKAELKSQSKRVAAALAGLDTIKATPATRVPDYRRDEFGPAWADVDGNGCRTRDDILARDLTKVKTEDGCKVLSGVLKDPYTGKTIKFTFGEKTSQAVQIDHIVSLSGAWKGGAYKWDDERREQFANDPANLLSVSGAVNASKSDKGPAKWMPRNAGNRGFDCEYAIRHTHILANYGLTAPSADIEMLRGTLERCS